MAVVPHWGVPTLPWREPSPKSPGGGSTSRTWRPSCLPPYSEPTNQQHQSHMFRRAARLKSSVTDAAAAAEASSRRSAARRRLWRTGCRPFVAAGSRSSGRGSSCRPPCIYSDGTKHGEAVSGRSSWKRFAQEYLFMGFFFCLFMIIFLFFFFF